MFNFGNRLGTTPPVVKNLIYINIVMFVATYAMQYYDINLTEILGLHYFESRLFRPYQLVTHMFMHGGLPHIFFNMFSLWMFGRVLESVWDSKRFFIYYIVTGLGAAAFLTLVNYIQYSQVEAAIAAFTNAPSADLYQSVVNKYFMPHGMFKAIAPNIFIDQPFDPAYAKEVLYQMLDSLKNINTIGASGAVFGVLLAFGMLFPNTVIMPLFPPIPIKAKWFVIIFGVAELYMGLTQPGSHIAHFAHLGGMLFGFILIKYWNSKRTNFY